MVNPETAFSPEDELDAGFRAAQAWFLANEVEMEEREQALARRSAAVFGIDPNVLCGQDALLREQLDTVGVLADAQELERGDAQDRARPHDRTLHRAAADDTWEWNVRLARRSGSATCPRSAWRSFLRRCGRAAVTDGRIQEGLGCA